MKSKQLVNVYVFDLAHDRIYAIDDQHVIDLSSKVEHCSAHTSSTRQINELTAVYIEAVEHTFSSRTFFIHSQHTQHNTYRLQQWHGVDGDADHP